jgi:DMSO/TMAO reductase YedYZ molybdopterin-dependent catalytic subunit
VNKERGLHELFNDDPERADALAFGRRGLLKGASLAAVGAAIGGVLPFGRSMPGGYIPLALAQDTKLNFPGKSTDLMILGDRPLVAETPATLLDADVTPTDVHFIRNNGTIPDVPAEPDAWQLVIDGEVDKPLTITLGDLKKRFPTVTYQLMLECGGNGRAQFQPPAKGNPWTTGGAGCAKWTGIRLRDVLQAVGLRASATYTGHFGVDQHLSGDPSKSPLSRGIPIAKALEEHTLLAFAMNGESLPQIHGAPLRLLVPGWTGSASQKWLNRIWIRDREHDGQGMKGTSYRVPTIPIVPGSESHGEGFRVLEAMPVRSLITSPADGQQLPSGTRTLDVRGHAWAGERRVREVWLSIDYGQSWLPTTLKEPVNRYAWQHWSAQVKVLTAGYYEIWTRPVDSAGWSQPFAPANWNPQGYGANAYHRIAVLVRT